MKNFTTKIVFICSLFLMTFGCQNQTVSNSPNQTNSSAVNSNTTNQTNAEIPAPQTVKFTSADNVEIVGTFYESPKANSPAVLLLHQFGSNRQPYDEFAKEMQKKSFGVLAIDGRGFGDSTKTTDGKLISPPRIDKGEISVPNSTKRNIETMIEDISEAFNFLAKQKNVDANRIGIVGASYLSYLAVMFAVINKNVKAVALISPYLNYFGNMPTDSAVKNYGDRPLLMVAAEDDKESADSVRKLKEVGANEKYETKIYDKGGHGTTLFAVGLKDLLEEFLIKNL